MTKANVSRAKAAIPIVATKGIATLEVKLDCDAARRKTMQSLFVKCTLKKSVTFAEISRTFNDLKPFRLQCSFLSFS